MFCDLGVIDRLVTTALDALNGGGQVLYVYRGDPQPNAEDNPDHLPWFRHKLKKTSRTSNLGALGPDRAEIEVTLVFWAPAENVEEGSWYDFSTVMSLAVAALYGKRLVDDPMTHEVVFADAVEDQDLGIGGDNSEQPMMQTGMATIRGLVCRTT